MFSLTQRRPSVWSLRPRFPGITASSVERNPAGGRVMITIMSGSIKDNSIYDDNDSNDNSSYIDNSHNHDTVFMMTTIIIVNGDNDCAADDNN